MTVLLESSDLSRGVAIRAGVPLAFRGKFGGHSNIDGRFVARGGSVSVAIIAAVAVLLSLRDSFA